MKLIKTIDSFLIKLQQFVLVVCVAAMVILIIWEVIARFVLKISTPYAEELTRLAMVWCIFFGSSLAVRFNGHAKLDAVLKKLPGVLQLVMKILIQLAIAILSFVIMYYGMIITIKAWPDRTTSLAYPFGVFYLPAVICGFLMMVYAIVNVFMIVSQFGKEHRKTIEGGMGK